MTSKDYGDFDEVAEMLNTLDEYIGGTKHTPVEYLELRLALERLRAFWAGVKKP